MSYYEDSDIDPCDLECVRTGGGRLQETVIHEYEGPVKITLVDLLDVGFWPRVWGAALITLASLYIAGIVATMVFFSLTFTAPAAVNLHIAMCMAGFQLLIPNGILMINPLFGGASQLLGHDRLGQHIFLQLFGFSFVFIGSMHVCTSVDSLPGNPHTITGIMALLGACVAVTLGAFHHYGEKPELKMAHKVAGMVTYIVSSFCTCLALIKPSFKSWCKTGLIKEVPYLLLILCVFCTAIIMMAVKCRIQDRNKVTFKYLFFFVSICNILAYKMLKHDLNYRRIKKSQQSNN